MCDYSSSCTCNCLPSGMAKFDREKAIAGHKLITRDGRGVEGIMYVHHASFEHDVIAVIAGHDNPTQHDRNTGEYYDSDGDRGDSDYDLFLQVPKPLVTIPFDLKLAMQGRKVVTRGGEEVEWLKFRDADIIVSAPLEALVKGLAAAERYTLQGELYGSSSNYFNLMLVAE